MSPPFQGTYRAVLFDLDGTLIDTAPDMARILNDMLRNYGYREPPFEATRSVVSDGSLGLIRLGFPRANDAEQRRLQREYLERYEQDVCRDSNVFPSLPELLDRLDQAGRTWGIVTNKPERMAVPLLRQLGLLSRAACTVSGDTLAQRKPDPAPLLYACQLAGIEPAETLYVGDAERDISAGRAAGMGTIAATYGYITAEDDPSAWQAEAIAADPFELSRMIADAVEITADE